LVNFDKFKSRVANNKHTLFLLVADECHWAALKDKPHDRYVNDNELLAAENVVVLLVSATPYCLLTADSRIPDTPRPVSPSAVAAAADPLHVVTWSATVSGDSQTRYVSQKDTDWLRKAQGETDLGAVDFSNLLAAEQTSANQSKVNYLSLDKVYLQPDRKLITPDEKFEKILRDILAQEDYKGTDASYVVAVDYAFQMLRQVDDPKPFATWLVKKRFPRNKQLIREYLKVHGVEQNAEGVLTLLKRWEEAQEIEESSLTKKIVQDLVRPDKACMQVLRVSGTSVAKNVVDFLKAVRNQLQLCSRFELLGDFGDLNVGTEISQEWFESFQAGKRCEQLHKGKQCTCVEFVSSGTSNKEKSKRYLDRRCKSCGHPHVRISSYGDLGDRSVLLILVAKGRLGDTFPSTFSCLDMRARFRSSCSAMMSTLVQELGRLCRYTTDETDEKAFPYALVSTELFIDLGMADKTDKAQNVSRVVKLLADHGSRLDSHMLLQNKDNSCWLTAPLFGLSHALTSMRTSHKARENEVMRADEVREVPDCDRKTASYDAGLRMQTQKERLHNRRLLLAAEPQIGKTGAVLALIEVLRLRLACKPTLASPIFLLEEPGGDVTGGEYPEYNALQESKFLHTKDSPCNGKYGDPAFDKLWEFFVVKGGMGKDAPPDLIQGLRGSTAGKRSAGSASSSTSAVAEPADSASGASEADALLAARAGAAAALGSADSPNGASEPNYLRYITCDYSARGACAADVEVSRTCRLSDMSLYLSDDDGRMKQCRLSLTQRSWDSDWIETPSGPRLKIEQLDSKDRVLFPILTPSSGRAKTALLDLRAAMQGARYVQIVCVKHEEFESYIEHFPKHNFFVLPQEADTFGVGAARFWTLQLARAICPVEFRFCFVMDDNVRAWKAVRMGDDDAFFSNLPFPFEHFANGKVGSKKDVPLKAVLKHFQARGFRNELHKFGMLGFDRLGRWDKSKCNHYARRHVYKAVIFNLNVINEKLNYKPNIHAMEDLEFNLRVSGMKRVPGGGSKALSEEEQMASGAWLDKEAKQGVDQVFVLDPSDSPGPPVICKCYGFAFHEDQEVSKHGGCSENVLSNELVSEARTIPPEPVGPCSPSDSVLVARREEDENRLQAEEVEIGLQAEEVKIRLNEAYDTFRLAEQNLSKHGAALGKVINPAEEDVYKATGHLMHIFQEAYSELTSARDECEKAAFQAKKCANKLVFELGKALNKCDLDQAGKLGRQATELRQLSDKAEKEVMKQKGSSQNSE